jgi:hypothetical protein
MLNFVERSIAVKVESFKIERDSTADEMRVAVSSHNSTLTPRILVNGVAPNDSVSALRKTVREEGTPAPYSKSMLLSV